jgi:hypothetical protein
MPPDSQAHRGRLCRDHPCAVGFLDETGAIPKDRIFAVGLLATQEPAALLRRIQKLRDRRHWYGEFKFAAVTRGILPLYQEFLDLILADEAGRFYCFVADRETADPLDRFGSHWDAYGKLAEQLTVGCVRTDELMSVLADNYSTPDDVLFEESLKASVNRRLRRLAVTSVCRLDSRSSNGLQAVDMLTSAVAFEFRAAAGQASEKSVKAELSRHARRMLGTASCLGAWRSRRHSVATYDHGEWRGVDP